MQDKRDKQRNKDDTLEARVTMVYETGPYGPYFVALADRVQGSVTCSLSPDVWTEADPPRVSNIVILGGITKTAGGLRATTARLWTLADEIEE